MINVTLRGSSILHTSLSQKWDGRGGRNHNAVQAVLSFTIPSQSLTICAGVHCADNDNFVLVRRSAFIVIILALEAEQSD